jgi:uncharacterized protein YajQ (UPF0234 family)
LIAEMSFTVKAPVKLKNLSGWKKGDRLPDRVSDFSQSLVAKCAADELKNDLDEVYDKLKAAFSFSRRELQAAEPHDGTGTIMTPHFSYSVTVTHNHDDLDGALWTRSVDSIKTPAQISSKAFAAVFDDVFNTLVFALPTKVNLEDFIDAVEAAKSSDLKIKYDREATYCEIEVQGAVGTVTLKAKSLSIVHGQRTKTHLLLESFETVRKLVQEYKLSPGAFAETMK